MVKRKPGALVSLEVLALTLLRDRKLSYASAIAVANNDGTRDPITVGGVSRALKRLEARELVEFVGYDSDTFGAARRVYRLTRKGRAALKAAEDSRSRA